MMRLPFHYVLDESDPDIVILRRRDGCFVAAFSASGATKEGIREAVIEDYRIFTQSPWICKLTKSRAATRHLKAHSNGRRDDINHGEQTTQSNRKQADMPQRQEWLILERGTGSAQVGPHAGACP